IKLHEDNEAIRLFDELLTHDPDYVGSYYHLGKALEKTGNIDQALEIYQKGIRIAQKLKDDHARRELQQAADDLI
ncbi:MAG: tetratricopeptide repeat protein, partial [Chitinophagaceae bacterium]